MPCTDRPAKARRSRRARLAALAAEPAVLAPAVLTPATRPAGHTAATLAF
jgi:hypothetical protein